MARDVRVNILGDARDFSRAVDTARRDAGRLDDSFGRVRGSAGRMAAGVALGATAVVGAGAAIGMSLVRAAEESQQVTRQTSAVLESMGATAWTTADQVARLSTQLSNQTGIDDELIQSGQNVLLTFGDVQNRIGEGNNIFDRATEAALNMSTALGTDMRQASMQVGRALNDPVRGLAALRRSGIQFTAQQEDQIRTMVEAGDTAGAQRVMLQELERQFGGSAEAQSTASQRLSTMWGNLQEQLGERLLPVFERITDWLIDMLPGALDFFDRAVSTARRGIERMVEIGQDLSAWAMEHKPIMIGVAAAIGVGLVAAFVAWAASAAAAAAATLAATWPIIAIGAAIAALVAGVIYAYQNWDWFRNTVDTVARFLRDTVWPIIQTGAGIIKDVLGGAIETVVGWFNTVKTVAETVWPAIRAAIDAVKGPIIAAFNVMFAPIQAAIDAWNALQNLLHGSVQARQLHTEFSKGRGTLGGYGGYHTGGMVTGGPPGSEVLARLQVGERVIPRGGVASDGGGVQSVVVMLDSQVLVDALVRHGRSNGPIPIRVAG